MDRTLLALVIGLGVALFFGYYVAQSSRRKQTIHGGVGAQVFHHIGATFIAGILPVILASLILGQGFRTAFPLAVSFLAVGWVALMVYAVIEHSARLKISTADQGWTKEDARKSY